MNNRVGHKTISARLSLKNLAETVKIVNKIKDAQSEVTPTYNKSYIHYFFFINKKIVETINIMERIKPRIKSKSLDCPCVDIISFPPVTFVLVIASNPTNHIFPTIFNNGIRTSQAIAIIIDGTIIKR